MPSAPGSLDQFQGCLLGQAVGDAVGAPFEGLPDDLILRVGAGSRIVAEPPRETLVYTDDTQMAIGVAEELIERGAIDEDALMARFAANYEPGRGYGAGAHRLLRTYRDGGDWRALTRGQFPGGSFGNGAAMRAAPIGLFFCDDLGRAAAEAAASSRPTHLHPLGIDGARLIAVGTALAATMEPFDRRVFFAELSRFAETEEFRRQLDDAEGLRPTDGLGAFGNGIEAHRSVVSAIACFAAHPDDYPGAIARAIGLGGDVDTLAAMAGALGGARNGLDGIPGHLVAILEDGPKGRTFLLDLAGLLHEAHRRRAGPAPAGPEG